MPSFHPLRPLPWLLLCLSASAFAGEPQMTEEEVTRYYQADACATSAQFVQVHFGNSVLVVRCQGKPAVRQARASDDKPPVQRRASEGFQKTRWGMTKSDVRKLYSDLRGRHDVLWFASTVAGYRAVTSFHFRDNSLIRVIVAFRPRGGERAEPECFAHVRDELIEKYGPPQADGEGSSWDTDETHIELSLDSAAVVNRLKAVYSRKGAPDPDDEDEKETPSGNGL